jgi:hypothetical protein
MAFPVRVDVFETCKVRRAHGDQQDRVSQAAAFIDLTLNEDQRTIYIVMDGAEVER